MPAWSYKPPHPAPLCGSLGLGGDGSVTINYIGNGPIGTAWQVSRRLSTETEFAYIRNADARTKSYLDTSVPNGSASADYQFVGVRGSVFGPASFAFNVKFDSAAPAQQGAEAA